MFSNLFQNILIKVFCFYLLATIYTGFPAFRLRERWMCFLRLKCSVKKSIRMVVLLFLYETYRMSLGEYLLINYQLGSGQSITAKICTYALLMASLKTYFLFLKKTSQDLSHAKRCAALLLFVTNRGWIRIRSKTWWSS